MIRTVAETGSTNADLLAQASGGAGEGLWLRAERQNGGRGRLGRSWWSARGNLHASTIVRLRAGEPSAASLALVAAVALAETVAAHVGTGRVLVKWPNDLMTDGAKLAGILLERANDAVVIGFGVNVASRPESFDRLTSSLRELGSHVTAAQLLDELVGAFARWLTVWREEGLGPVRAAWMERAHPIGTPLNAAGVEGVFAGLDEQGGLLLRHADGRIETIHAGDVALI